MGDYFGNFRDKVHVYEVKWEITSVMNFRENVHVYEVDHSVYIYNNICKWLSGVFQLAYS